MVKTKKAAKKAPAKKTKKKVAKKVAKKFVPHIDEDQGKMFITPELVLTYTQPNGDGKFYVLKDGDAVRIQARVREIPIAMGTGSQTLYTVRVFESSGWALATYEDYSLVKVAKGLLQFLRRYIREQTKRDSYRLNDVKTRIRGVRTDIHEGIKLWNCLLDKDPELTNLLGLRTTAFELKQQELQDAVLAQIPKKRKR